MRYSKTIIYPLTALLVISQITPSSVAWADETAATTPEPSIVAVKPLQIKRQESQRISAFSYQAKSKADSTSTSFLANSRSLSPVPTADSTAYSGSSSAFASSSYTPRFATEAPGRTAASNPLARYYLSQPTESPATSDPGSTATVTSYERQRQNNSTAIKNSVLDYLAGLARRFADAFKSTRETSPALADNNSTSDRDPNVTSGTVAAVYGPSGASPSGSKASSDSLNSSPEGSQTPDGGQADGSFGLAGGNNSGKNGDSSAGNGNNSGDNSNFSGDNGFSPAGGPRQQGFLGKLAAITGQNERDLSVFERSTITCADGSWCAELRRDTYVTMAFVEIERIVVRAVNGIEYVLHMPFNSNDFRIVQAYPEAQRDRDPLALAIVKSRHTATASHPDTTLDKLKGPQPDTQVYAMSAPASKEKRSFDFKFNQSFSSSRKDL